MTKQDLLQFWKEMNVDENILKAFEEIPREDFVPKNLLEQAYDDNPLPTLRKQSVSQPTTIMVMLQALELKPGDKVFEIGAGVGYQAALIAKLIAPGKLITTEVIPELVKATRDNLKKLNITNVEVIEGDGSEGHLEAPFDKVVITAACPAVPEPLVEQMKEGAIVVAPVGSLLDQTMVKGVKNNNRLELEFLGSFRFVPLIGKHGFKEVELME
jgi:protein-L-isoaspartate(D-aspartate) O-methyltransferase